MTGFIKRPYSYYCVIVESKRTTLNFYGCFSYNTATCATNQHKEYNKEAAQAKLMQKPEQTQIKKGIYKSATMHCSIQSVPSGWWEHKRRAHLPGWIEWKPQVNENAGHFLAQVDWDIIQDTWVRKGFHIHSSHNCLSKWKPFWFMGDVQMQFN